MTFSQEYTAEISIPSKSYRHIYWVLIQCPIFDVVIKRNNKYINHYLRLILLDSKITSTGPIE